MMANNETGVLFPIAEIGKIIREHSDAVFHVDGVQAVGKIPINLKTTEVDLFAFSGHKLHAPQGVGVLYVRDGVNLPPFIIGGDQESGTACRDLSRAEYRWTRRGLRAGARTSTGHETIEALRNKLERQILNRFRTRV